MESYHWKVITKNIKALFFNKKKKGDLESQEATATNIQVDIFGK